MRRFLTYYLPRAADLAEAYAILEKSGNRDTTRLVATSDLIDRLHLRDFDIQQMRCMPPRVR